MREQDEDTRHVQAPFPTIPSYKKYVIQHCPYGSYYLGAGRTSSMERKTSDVGFAAH